MQLIDATSFWVPMRKSLGDKRREIPLEKAEAIVSLLRRFEEGEHVKIFPTTHFGFRKVNVERPRRLNFQASAERIARLHEESAFRGLAVSKKKGAARAHEEAEGRGQQDAILAMLGKLPDTVYKDREQFESALASAAHTAGLKLAAPIKKAILSALSERDEVAAICRDPGGDLEPDPELRDTEQVPLAEPVDVFFQREVTPHVPDAWIDTDRRDPKDGEIGMVGYEINFNRYFYRYLPPRGLEEIEADIRVIEQDILRMLAEVGALITLGKRYEAEQLDVRPYLRVANVQDAAVTGKIDVRDESG